MNIKFFGIILVVILIVCVLFGCTSEKKPSENSSKENTAYSSDTSGGLQSDNNNSTANSDESATTENPGKSEEEQIPATGISEATESDETGADSNAVTVVFKDTDGNVLKSEKVKKGDDAAPPDDPVKDGYKFIGWNYDFEDVKTDLEIVPIFEEITEPTLTADNVTAKPGEKVDVAVSVNNNPGLLGLVVNIQFDDRALTLTDVSNGSLMNEYVFTPPKNMKSDCNAAWNINDVPEDNKDGEIMVLHFKVSNKAEAGEHSITVSCLNNAFDDSYNSFSFDSIGGSINVK